MSTAFLLYPVVVGAGQRLFEPDRIDKCELTLIGAQTFTSGVVLLRYQPA